MKMLVGTGPRSSRLAANTTTESVEDTMRRGVASIGLTLVSVLAFVSSALAQGNTHLRVDGERIKSYIEFLSTDEMMGRQSMTPAYQKAAEWVAAQYEAWGLEPAGDNGTYFQKVPINRDLTWYSGVPAVKINGTPQSLVEGDFTINQASTVGTEVDAEVAYRGASYRKDRACPSGTKHRSDPRCQRWCDGGPWRPRC